MSSDVVARVYALYQKAEELADKGHLLRAAEIYGRAADAARALGPDSLVALDLQLRQGTMLSCFATAPEAATADPRVLEAQLAQCATLFSCGIEALERRRAAGTLQEGTCAAAEVAWRAREIQQANVNFPPALAASLASLAGYDQYLHAAKVGVDVLAHARLFGAVYSAAQFELFAQHVVRAAELMQQPRRHDAMAMPIEAEFIDVLRDAVARAAAADAGASGLDARLEVQLADAWRRLQRSGVLQARGIEESIRSKVVPEQEAFDAAVQKSLTAPGLRSCALDGCGAREAQPAHFKSCAACRTVVYCCREHQVAGWPAHKKACKAARKAAAAEDGGAGPRGA